MIYENRITLPTSGVQSLCWEGDSLVDWVGGRAQYKLDGSVQRATVHYAYRFDTAAVSPSGRFAVLYERLGTKAILLERGKIIRELNRSYYQADKFDYPIALFPLPDGREVIAHCPNHYNQLEIDEIATGKPLTYRPRAEPTDIFHSRLAANTAGTYLLSAGWVWQPEDTLYLFDIAFALTEPEHLNKGGILLSGILEPVHGAAFLGDSALLVSATGNHQQPTLFVIDLPSLNVIYQIALENPEGVLMPLDDTHMVGFYDHPKLIHLPTGQTLYHWHDLKSGHKTTSLSNSDVCPPLALDARNRRFAVAGVNAITVVTVG